MRIMHLVSARSPNGAVLHCLDLCAQQARRGHHVTLVHRFDQFEPGDFDGTSVEVMRCNFKRWPLSHIRDFANLVKEQEIDIIHTHCSSAHFFGVLLRRIYGIPTVATSHSALFQLHWPLNDFVIANSAATYRFQNRINLVPKRKLELVHYFINVQKFESVAPAQVQSLQTQWNATPGFTIGVVGELTPRKGQIELIRAMPAILQQFPQAKLIIVGSTARNDAATENYLQQMQGAIKEHNLTEQVVFHGYSKQIEVIMNAIDICAVPSRREPFGLVAAEAMSAKKPVVASAVGGLPDIVRHEKNGLLVKPNSPNELAATIIRLFAQPDLQTQLGTCGHQYVTESFSIEPQISKIENIYAGVLARHGVTKTAQSSAT